MNRRRAAFGGSANLRAQCNDKLILVALAPTAYQQQQQQPLVSHIPVNRP